MDRIDPKVAQVVSELANATQILAGIAARLVVTLGAASEDAVALDAAVARTVRALRSLQPAKEKK